MSILIPILAVIGIVDTAYLIYKSSKKGPLICPLGSDCNAVLNSQWSKTMGVRNDYLGLLFFIGMGFLYFVGNSQTEFSQIKNIADAMVLYGSGFGFLFSAYLTYVQLYKIKNFCFYCLVSALTTTAIFLTALFM